MSITAKSKKTFYAEQVNEESFEKIENGLKAQMPGLLQR